MRHLIHFTRSGFVVSAVGLIIGADFLMNWVECSEDLASAGIGALIAAGSGTWLVLMYLHRT